jgi:hypothetical protein
MAEGEPDQRAIQDFWDGPIIRPVSAEEVKQDRDAEDVDTPDVSTDKPHSAKSRSVGSTTLGAARGWSGGWSD